MILITIEYINDPERAAREGWAGPWGVTIYPTAHPDSDWRFSLLGLPTKGESMRAWRAEIARRERAGIYPREETDN